MLVPHLQGNLDPQSGRTRAPHDTDTNSARSLCSASCVHNHPCKAIATSPWHPFLCPEPSSVTCIFDFQLYDHLLHGLLERSYMVPVL